MVDLYSLIQTFGWVFALEGGGGEFNAKGAKKNTSPNAICLQ